ncbi:aspartate/methionine/tyrosine aminotransferase [Streptacidiphilus sp. MAP12-33]
MDEDGVAWVTRTPELVAAVRTAKQYLTYVSAGPFQYAVAEALRLPDSCFDGFRADLARKRDILATGLRAAGFEVYEPQRTYVITTDVAPFGEQGAYTFCRELPRRCGAVAIPNSVFHDDEKAGRSQVRFTFCKQDHVPTEAVTRLRHLAER